MPSPGGQVSEMAGRGISPTSVNAYHTAARGHSLAEVPLRRVEGCPPGHRAVGRCHCRRDDARAPTYVGEGRDLGTTKIVGTVSDRKQRKRTRTDTVRTGGARTIVTAQRG